MKSVQLVARRMMEPREMPIPRDPGPGEVLLKVRAVGVCGSDMHWYLEGGIGEFPAVYPQILGHEPAGEIAAVGPGVEGIMPGQKVAIEPAITCGSCEYCRSGHHNNCVRSVFMSSPQMPGLFVEHAVVPARNVVPVPESMSFVEATVIEPLSVILHILELTPVQLGDSVAVLGAGPIGMLTACIARLSGASQVIVADREAHRLEWARGMGFERTVHTGSESLAKAVVDWTRGRGVDIAFDAAAAGETINAAIRIARLGGRVVLVGIPSERNLGVDWHTAMNKELSVQTIKRSNHNAHAAIEFLQTGSIPKSLITHRMALEQTPAAFEMLANYADAVGKVVIEVG